MFQCFYFFCFPLSKPFRLRRLKRCKWVGQAIQESHYGSQGILLKKENRNEKDILLKSFNGNILAEYFLLKVLVAFNVSFKSKNIKTYEA